MIESYLLLSPENERLKDPLGILYKKKIHSELTEWINYTFQNMLNLYFPVKTFCL